MTGNQRDLEIHFINEKHDSHKNRSRGSNSCAVESQSSPKRVQFDLTFKQTVEGDFDETGS